VESQALRCKKLLCPWITNSHGKVSTDYTFEYNGSCLKLGQECNGNEDKFLAYTVTDPVPSCYVKPGILVVRTTDTYDNVNSAVRTPVTYGNANYAYAAQTPVTYGKVAVQTSTQYANVNYVNYVSYFASKQRCAESIKRYSKLLNICVDLNPSIFRSSQVG